jgi:predicted NBD/HSP70 family sugar kinase
MKRENLTAGEFSIVSRLLRKGPLANIELSTSLGLSASTVSLLLKKLTGKRLISEIQAEHYLKPTEESQRRRKTFAVNQELGYALTAEIDYDHIVLSRIGFDLNPVSSRKVPTRGNDRTSIFDQLDDEIAVELKSGGERCLGLGFSLPGHVDVKSLTSIRNTRMKNWQDVSFAGFESFCSTVIIENLANAKAAGEYAAGYGRELDDFLFLNVDNGTGMGIVIHGELYRGARFTAGEAGHVIVNEESENICTCGNRGCLESYVSNKSVHTRLLRLKTSDVDSGLFDDPDFGIIERAYPLLARHYAAGDKVAYLTVNEIAHHMGLACASFLHLFAPEKIIIGGAVTELGEGFIDLVVNCMRRYHLPWQGPINLSFPADNSHVGAQGLAYQVFRKHLGGTV